MDRTGHRVARTEEGLEAVPGPDRGDARTVPRYGHGDFADLWERAAADGTPVRALVGDDPVEFAETFAQSYGGKRWIDKERARLIAAIDDAERGEPT